MRKAQRARDVLREIPIDDLIARAGAAGELYMNATLPMGDGTQTPEEFARAQSASTGLPERMCRANMKKNAFVLDQMRAILTSLTRGLSLDILSRGYGEERGVPLSYQVQSPVVGLVLPSNSPGVHTLWLPVIPMQIGLVLKPGPQEPWTPYRMAAAFIAAGIPREAIGVYPGAAKWAPRSSIVASAPIFGSTETVKALRGNPHVQVHGPGFRKAARRRRVDNWENTSISSSTAFISIAAAVASTARRVGFAPHERNRPSPGRAAWADRRPSARRSSGAGCVHGPGPAQTFTRKFWKKGRIRRRGHDREIWSAYGGTLRFDRGSSCDPRREIPIPVHVSDVTVSMSNQTIEGSARHWSARPSRTTSLGTPAH
jgi:hypothetical protein